MPASGEHHPAFEEYCECIFELAEDDVDVIQARIAERLEVSRPAVSEMIRRMEKAATFPKRIQLGQNRVGWIESEVLEWLHARIENRDDPTDDSR